MKETMAKTGAHLVHVCKILSSLSAKRKSSQKPKETNRDCVHPNFNKETFSCVGQVLTCMASHVYKFKSPAKQIIFSDDWLYCCLCPVPKIPATEQSCGLLKNENTKTKNYH